MTLLVVVTRGNEPPRITELCALDLFSSDKFYSTYVDPKRAIHPDASKMTMLMYDKIAGLRFGEGTKSVKVPAVPFKQAICKFLHWLGNDTAILVAHSGIKFDFPVLCAALSGTGQLQEFTRKVVGFVDTMPLLKDMLPNDSYGFHKLNNLVEVMLKTTTKGHSAYFDVLNLQLIVLLFTRGKTHILPKPLSSASFPWRDYL